MKNIQLCKMKTILHTLLFQLLFTPIVAAQTGTLQIYCMDDATIYFNDKYHGKSKTEMSGYLAENLPIGELTVRIYKSGYSSQTKNVLIESNKVVELVFELVEVPTNRLKMVGVDGHFGTFGLFNVNNEFTKADFSLGATPYLDVYVHPNFSIGGELMLMWGKPQTSDPLRMMTNSNLRLKLNFSPFEKVHFDILVASGFAWWPSTSLPNAYLTPTLNENRFGWDFRAMAGAAFVVSSAFQWHVNFGYWASSSTSDDITWITHDTMLISIGPRFVF
jgi:hypothetical protein